MAATIKLIDLTPKFLKFHELAVGADPERRWELWQEHYRFAAVPPTEDGMRKARKMLDESFHRYPEVLDTIRAGAAGFRPDPQEALNAICQLFELPAEAELEVQFVLFVGNFEGNAFAYTMNGVPRVHFPVETEFRRDTMLPHEFAHVVHERLSGGGAHEYLRTIAYLAMMEGLAIHASRRVAPGRPEAEYIEFEAGWLDACRAREPEMLAGIRPFLAEVSQEAMWRFVMGEGTTGLDREAYYVGYRVVGHLLSQGRTLGELARLTEVETVSVVAQVLTELTGAS